MVQLPALNTPQFDHCRTRMPKQPMPVPPMYQPEVAADGIHFAAHAKRRQVYVGGTTVATIAVAKAAPGFADRYLARTGVKGQQTEPSIEPREGNLFEAESDPGAHGRFDAQAKSRSYQLWLDEHRGAVIGLAAGALAGLGIRRIV
jgi:hypothetical protein